MAQQLPDPEPPLFRYSFRESLTEGVIIKKRKRFTAEVLVNGRVVVAHCPTTCLSLYQTLLNGQQVPSGLHLCIRPAAPIMQVAIGTKLPSHLLLPCTNSFGRETVIWQLDSGACEQDYPGYIKLATLVFMSLRMPCAYRCSACCQGPTLL